MTLSGRRPWHAWRCLMKIVVVGGSGLIGSKVVAIRTRSGHEVVAASRRSGVDAVTGEGLSEAVSGAAVVVDVSNSPSFEDAAVMKFFKITRNGFTPVDCGQRRWRSRCPPLRPDSSS
jgi:uncharacterized protein YbjT (DUF2867 family)